MYIIDFGLSKQFRDPDTRRHIPYSTSLGFTGTADFASVNSHQGSELGRRDDLESLAYILIYFVRGSLPWQGMGQNIHVVKQSITSHSMFKELPAEFLIFLQHCRSLAFDDKPNYDYYLNLFNNLLPEAPRLTSDWLSGDKAGRRDAHGMYALAQITMIGVVTHIVRRIQITSESQITLRDPSAGRSCSIYVFCI